MISRALTLIAHNNNIMIWASCIALVIFFSYFAFLLFWLFRKNVDFNYLSKLPIENDIQSTTKISG